MTLFFTWQVSHGCNLGSSSLFYQQSAVLQLSSEQLHIEHATLHYSCCVTRLVIPVAQATVASVQAGH